MHAYIYIYILTQFTENVKIKDVQILIQIEFGVRLKKMTGRLIKIQDEIMIKSFTRLVNAGWFI